jgi:hypothetical protein
MADDLLLGFAAGQANKFFIGIEDESLAVGENVPRVRGFDERMIEPLFLRRRDRGLLGKHVGVAV